MIPRWKSATLNRAEISIPWPVPLGVSALAWSPDGRRLATACSDYRIYVWDAENGQRQSVLEGHSRYIMNLAFNHAENLLASTSLEGLTRLWNLDSGRQIASYPGGSWTIQFSPDDRFLLGWQYVDRYGSLELAYSRECRLLYAERASVFYSGPDFNADGNILAAGTEDHVCFWDAFSGKEIGSIPAAEV